MWLPDHLRKWKYRWRGADFERKLLLQFTIISSYTVDARITKPICMIPLYIQMVATYLKFFYIIQFWNNADFRDFTPKCNFSGNFSWNWFKFFKSMGESHIHNISKGFYHVTSRSPLKMEIQMEGGGFWKKIVCYFSLPASPPTLLMLESPNLYAWYPYAYRWWQRIWNFSTSSSFEIIQILVILPKNAISLGIYHEISSNF